jgi:hypothetical protein
MWIHASPLAILGRAEKGVKARGGGRWALNRAPLLKGKHERERER